MWAQLFMRSDEGKTIGRRKFIGLSLLSLLSACTASSLGSEDSSTIALTISVASSLQDAIQEIGNLYTQKNPHIQLTYNFGSSGSLRYQIEQGAPVDVYISAAEQHMDALENHNFLLDNTRQNLLKNEVVLIADRNNSDFDGFSHLKSNFVNKIAIGAPDSVPAGKYAKEVLDSLKLYQPVESKLVFAKDVRQVLAYVETGNVDAGIVYRTDARVSVRVKIVATAPRDSHSSIVYPIAIVQDSQHPEAAQYFIKFILSDAAQDVFIEYGFKK